MCFRRFALFSDHHSAMLTAHIGLQHVPGSVFIPGREALHDGVINFFHLVPLELAVEFAMCFSRARKNHYAAGDLVQAVDDPNFVIILFEHIAQVRRIRLPALGEDRKSGRFTDYDDLLIEMEKCPYID